MRVMYRANGDEREISEEAGMQLLAAGIVDAIESKQKEPPKGPPKPAPKKPSDKPTKVEPMTTEDMPTVQPQKVA
jgi:hypothetical protein